jgi:uncharacterized protein (DUF433 family)
MRSRGGLCRLMMRMAAVHHTARHSARYAIMSERVISAWAAWRERDRQEGNRVSTATDIKYIVRDDDIYGGKPCIAGHRIAVHDIAVWHNAGYTPDRIIEEIYPTLRLPEVYAALLYYYEHKDEIDAEIASENAEIRARAAADTSPVAQKLRALRGERHFSPDTP